MICRNFILSLEPVEFKTAKSKDTEPDKHVEIIQKSQKDKKRILPDWMTMGSTASQKSPGGKKRKTETDSKQSGESSKANAHKIKTTGRYFKLNC